MYRIPTKLTDELVLFAKTIGCQWLGAVRVSTKPLCRPLNCHNNVIRYIDTYGGEHILGYYFIQHIDTLRFEAVLHSVLKKNGVMLDITPFDDNRELNLFGIINNDGIGIDQFLPHIEQ